MAGTCARDRRALQQHDLNVHVKLSDLTSYVVALRKQMIVRYKIMFELVLIVDDNLSAL